MSTAVTNLVSLFSIFTIFPQNISIFIANINEIFMDSNGVFLLNSRKIEIAIQLSQLRMILINLDPLKHELHNEKAIELFVWPYSRSPFLFLLYADTWPKPTKLGGDWRPESYPTKNTKLIELFDNMLFWLLESSMDHFLTSVEKIGIGWSLPSTTYAMTYESMKYGKLARSPDSIMFDWIYVTPKWLHRCFWYHWKGLFIPSQKEIKKLNSTISEL